MFKKLLILALMISSIPLSTAIASPFALKGLDTGQGINDIKTNQYKLKCNPWARDTDLTFCMTYYPNSGYSTLADQQVLAVSFIHSPDSTIHSVSFYLSCSANYQLLDNSLQHKFGKPTKTTPSSNVWHKENSTLTLLSQDGNDGVCYIVTNSDIAFEKNLRSYKQGTKRSEFSKDL